MERIWYVLTGGDCKLIKNLMTEFEETGNVMVPKEITEALQKVVVDTFVATDDVIRRTMKRTWDAHEYLVCPHTATGVAYHYQQLQK